MGTCMVVSSICNYTVEDIAQATEGGLRWCQLHPVRDMKVNKEAILRAEKAGCKAIVITVDAPALGHRSRPHTIPEDILPSYFHEVLKRPVPAELNRQMSDQMMMAEGVNKLFNPCLTWKSIDWFCSITQLPILLKGILTAEDALEALKHDIQGIIVSNHGGRQLDGVPATVSVVVSSPMCT